MGQNESKHSIYITIQVGETQSQQLFDFHSKDNQIVISQLISNNACIVQEGTNIVYQSDISQPQKLLYHIHYTARQMQLESSLYNDRTIWKVLEHQEIYPLEISSIVKIGKVKLRLKKIVQQYQRKSTQSRAFYRDDQEQIRSISNVGSNINQNECRMCFQSINTIENPLISLCKCSGSVKYTHYQCLKEWINNNVVKRQQNNILFFSYQETKCQICKHNFSPFFTIKKQNYQLLNFQKAPHPPYAIFQQIQEEQSVNRHSIFLIGIGQDQITIGRNSSSTIVMKEISVSRNHCSMIYRNKQLYIKDKGSKFGTLVKIQDETEFNPAKGLRLQIQSKLIRIFEKNTLQCCCADMQKLTFRVIKGGENGMYSKNDELQLSQRVSQIL